MEKLIIAIRKRNDVICETAKVRSLQTAKDKRSVLQRQRTAEELSSKMSSEKCHCKQYAESDPRAALIKMKLPDYSDTHYGGSGYTICRAVRFISYIVVVVLLGYSLWRIRVIENNLAASDRLVNISHLLRSNMMNHHRATRSIDTEAPARKPLQTRQDFENLVNSLYDKIKAMHDDDDKSHFDENMSRVFHAWLPVFDTLLPKEDRQTRSVDSSFEVSSEVIKKSVVDWLRKKVNPASPQQDDERIRGTRSVKNSAESSEEKDNAAEVVKDVAKSRDDSSEEQDKDKVRPVRAAEDVIKDGLMYNVNQRS